MMGTEETKQHKGFTATLYKINARRIKCGLILTSQCKMCGGQDKHVVLIFCTNFPALPFCITFQVLGLNCQVGPAVQCQPIFAL